MTLQSPPPARVADSAPSQTSSPRARLAAFGRYPRVVALDIARGIAVLGMAAAHTLVLPEEVLWNDPATWTGLVSGRSAILFAVLAGISIAIMTGRTRVPAGAELGRARLQLVARGVVIFAIGLVLELLGTNIAVILTFYGAVYAVAILFIGMRLRSILIWATALALLGPATLAGILGLSMSSWGSGVGFLFAGVYSIIPWAALMLAGLALGRLDLRSKKTAVGALILGVTLSAIGYSVGALWGSDYADKDISVDSASASYGGFAFLDPLSDSSAVSDKDSSAGGESEFGFSVIPGEDADLTGMLCDDYGDGYLSCYPEDDAVKIPGEDPGIDDAENDWSTYLEAIAASDIGTGMLAQFLSSSPHSGGTMEILGSGGLAVAIIGLLLITGQSLRYLLLPLAAIGSMPLTAYSAHVIAIFIVAGPGGWAQPPLLFPLLAAGLLIGCTAWIILAGRGPLESLTALAAARFSARIEPRA